MISRHTGQKEAKSLSFKKSSRTAANPAMEGAHTPSEETTIKNYKAPASQNTKISQMHPRTGVPSDFTLDKDGDPALSGLFH